MDQARSRRVVVVVGQRQPGRRRPPARVHALRGQAYGWEYVLLDEGWNGDDVPGLARYAAQARRAADPVDGVDGRCAIRRRARGRSRSGRRGAIAGVKVDFLLSDSARADGDLRRHRARRRARGTWSSPSTAARSRAASSVRGRTCSRSRRSRAPSARRPARAARRWIRGQDVDLAFTRNAIGSMDYTPVTFSARNRRSTDAHRLALAIVYESGLQHFADTPESYAAAPAGQPAPARPARPRGTTSGCSAARPTARSRSRGGRATSGGSARSRATGEHSVTGAAALPRRRPHVRPAPRARRGRRHDGQRGP